MIANGLPGLFDKFLLSSLNTSSLSASSKSKFVLSTHKELFRSIIKVENKKFSDIIFNADKSQAVSSFLLVRRMQMTYHHIEIQI